MSTRSPLVQSVERAISILKAFTRTEPELGVGDISRRVGLPKSTVFRLLATLEDGKLISKNPETGLYRLGIELVALANNAMVFTDLQRVVRPYLRQLASELNETVSLSALDDSDVVNLELFVSPERLIMRVGWIGRRMPIHATSSGRAIIAFKSEEEQNKILLEPLEKFTSRTITTTDALRAELSDVRKNGYAIAIEEMEEGLNAVAMPIWNHEGQVVACLSVSGPSNRLTKERIYEIIPTILEKSKKLSEELGYRSEK